jgi:membrane associated rhomboid family serine protease
MGLPIVTYSLILINIIVFMLIGSAPTISSITGIFAGDLLATYGLTPAYVLTGQKLYTIITSMFIHAGITHLLGNMFYLFVFGDNVEASMGKKNFLLLYFASGIGATIFHLTSTLLIPGKTAYQTLLQTGLSPWHVPAVGASGAISGVLGAYLLLFPRAEIKYFTIIGFIPVILRMPAAVYILIWFIFQLLYGLASLGLGVNLGVAFWAHIGGFLTGIALAPKLLDRRRYADLLRYYY